MIFHYVWRSVFSNLSPAQAKKLLLDIIDYAESGVQPKKQKPEVENAFSLIRYTIDEDTRKYDEKTNRLNANTRKRTKKAAKIESDNVNDNENENEKENSNENVNVDVDEECSILAPTPATPAYFIDDNFLKEFFSHEIQIEQLCYNLRTSVEELKEIAESVINEWILVKQKHSSYSDAARHLISVIRKVCALPDRRDWRTILETETLKNIQNNGY